MPEARPPWLRPDWDAPPGVRAAVTTRAGGVSSGRYASFNLAAHVGDDPAGVAANRVRLRQGLTLPGEPRWLRQAHGASVAYFDGSAPTAPSADAAVTFEPGVVLAVLTADCLPVLFAARDGSAVGIAHAGWRGLAAGVIEATLAALALPPESLRVWLAPAIGPRHYEVGEEVHEAFVSSPGIEKAFAPTQKGHWHCDLAALARARLAAAGVRDVAGGHWDTFADPRRFYSHRREGETGRMASLVWFSGH
jgi:YfiH family protein